MRARTLLYILLAIAILSVVIAILVNTRDAAPDKMRPSELTNAKLKRIYYQLVNFYSANHRWPSLTDWKQELKPYLEADGARGFLSFDKVTIDAWGSQIQCLENTNGNGLIVYSFGENQTDDHGTNDDIAVVVVKP